MGLAGNKQLASVTVERSDDLYKIVNSLNRTLKKRDLMFGLAVDETNNQKMIFTIYET
ncbi:YpmA family protein [Salipaludibacillus agaradhaerens]|uniref:YpmA family protein n=1 Tax=Salipaludibacillus agaradhaerens TaxID=76935 RepID=A0A9Q4FYL5_SALAG|nr:YpmA family protein [Salipaludibacillus agaradhaerens]MCR6096481.1 YpmA family protein [Salipaludibacillus agaradhaerens]MCR6113960.1 YpmA family protein [Salipaludibacillus agaradhaerens]